MGFWDDLTGTTAANASKAAAQDTYTKQQQAIGELNNYGDQYAGEFRNLAQGYQPYVGAGNDALKRLLAGLGLGGNPEEFTQAYRATPGYQAGLDTGTRAVTTNAAARGALKSGGALKALQTFGQNYEDQKSGDYLSRLMALSGQGQGAVGAQNSTVAQGLAGQLGTRQTAYGGAMNAAGTIGQGDIAAANAQSQGASNILNAGMKLGGMALGAFNPLGGLMGGSAYGQSSMGGGFGGGTYGNYWAPGR